jgi:hypothetical protein
LARRTGTRKLIDRRAPPISSPSARLPRLPPSLLGHARFPLLPHPILTPAKAIAITIGAPVGGPGPHADLLHMIEGVFKWVLRTKLPLVSLVTAGDTEPVTETRVKVTQRYATPITQPFCHGALVLDAVTLGHEGFQDFECERRFRVTVI